MLEPPDGGGAPQMGQAFQDTILDAVIRHQRRHGGRTWWLGGADHAGIATRKITEPPLATQG